MAWRFRKRIKIAPGVHINLSKGGVSTTVGVPGASVSFGKNGTYLNTGIPGTGLYNRTKIGGKTNSSDINPSANGQQMPLLNQQLPKNNPDKKSKISCAAYMVAALISLAILGVGHDMHQSDGAIIAVILLWVLFIGIMKLKKNKDTENNQVQIDAFLNNASSKGSISMTGLKKQIFDSYVNCMKLHADIENERLRINTLENKLAKKEKEEWREELTQAKAALEGFAKQFAEIQYDAEKDLQEEEKNKYVEFIGAFTNLMKCQKVWYVNEMIDNDDVKSSASSLVKKTSASLSQGGFGFIKVSNWVPVFNNGNMLLYFFPKFIIKSSINDVLDFDVFPYDDVVVSFQSTRFVEDGPVPTDAKQIGYTYQYVNKNGGPDRRYSYNPRYPLLQYGDIFIGLNSNFRFQFSNCESAEKFVQQFHNLTQKINKTELDKTNDNSNSMMTEKYYYLTREAAFNLFEFYKSLNENPEFISELNNAHGLELMDTVTDYCLNSRLSILAQMDIVTCYKQMEIPVDTEEIERLPLALLFGKMTDDSFSPMYDQIFSDRAEGFFRHMRSYASSLAKTWKIEAVPDEGEMPVLNFMYTLQSLCSKDIVDRYAVLLYRFNSVVAKADNTINSIESRWLSTLSTYNNQSASNIDGGEKKKKKEANGKVDKIKKQNPYEELNDLIGLASVKDEVTRLTNFIKIQLVRQSKGLKSSPISYHCVFTGNPGTGKTTVARIIAGIYKDLGILKKGQLIETDRSGLVAEYVGQTAVKTNKIIDTALDGVLFIDEAYTLVGGGGNDFGGEAIATLLKRMEDNRDRLVVILAGYGNEMKDFIDSNPGLQSRFSRYINFTDYNTEELYQIYCLYLKKNDYIISDEAAEVIKKKIDNAVANKDKNFGNARFIRNLFERTLENQATRLASIGELTEDNLTAITIDDVMNL